MVVVGAAQIGVIQRQTQLIGSRQGPPIEPLLEDRGEAFVADGAQRERACTGRFQAGLAVGRAQAQHPETGIEGLLRGAARRATAW